MKLRNGCSSRMLGSVADFRRLHFSNILLQNMTDPQCDFWCYVHLLVLLSDLCLGLCCIAPHVLSMVEWFHSLDVLDVMEDQQVLQDVLAVVAAKEAEP